MPKDETMRNIAFAILGAVDLIANAAGVATAVLVDIVTSRLLRTCGRDST